MQKKLIISDTSNHFDSFKASEVSRIGYVTVPYTITYRDNTSLTKDGTALLIETTNGKTYQLHLEENSNVVSILKNNGFNVIEAFAKYEVGLKNLCVILKYPNINIK